MPARKPWRPVLAALAVLAAVSAGILAFSAYHEAREEENRSLLEHALRNPALNSPDDITDDLISRIITGNLESLTVNYEFSECRHGRILSLDIEENDESYSDSVASGRPDDDYEKRRLYKNPFWRANSRTPLRNIPFRVIFTPQVTSLACAFSDFRELESANLEIPASVRDFSRMFRDAPKFNGPVAGWDTSGAISIRQMFYKAASFNQPLNSWNTAAVQDMRSVFFKAASFNPNSRGYLLTTNTYSATILFTGVTHRQD
jgi:surface protein